MFLRLLYMENIKIYKRRLFWIGLVILGVLIAAQYTTLFALRNTLPGNSPSFSFWPMGLLYGLNFASGFLPFTSWGLLLLIVVMGTVIGQEYSWRTIQLWLSRGVSRPLLFGAKLASTLIPMVLLALVGLLVCGGLSAIFTVQVYGNLHANMVDFAQLALSYLRVTYIMFPYIALVFMLATITRSTVGTVCGAMVVLLVVEPGLGLLLPMLGKPFAQIAQFLPFQLGTTIASQNYALAHMAAPSVSPLAPGAGIAYIGIALYTLIFCGIAFRAFQRQDLAN